MGSGGRKSLEPYLLENIERIKKLRREGYLINDIATMLGVGHTTFIKYTNSNPELKKALQESKEALIEDIEDNLFRLAKGLCKEKTTKKYIEDVDGKQRQRIEETVKEIPPNIGAIVFSLKNLAPDKWKDTRSFESALINMDTLKNSETLFQKMQKAMNTEDGE